MGRLFGTDGIRGKYGDVITESLAKKVAYALPCFNIPVVLVGMDTRESSLSLKNELIKALKQVNFNVHDFNVISTNLGNLSFASWLIVNNPLNFNPLSESIICWTFVRVIV